MGSWVMRRRVLCGRQIPQNESAWWGRGDGESGGKVKPRRMLHVNILGNRRQWELLSPIHTPASFVSDLGNLHRGKEKDPLVEAPAPTGRWDQVLRKCARVSKSFVGEVRARPLQAPAPALDSEEAARHKMGDIPAFLSKESRSQTGGMQGGKP